MSFKGTEQNLAKNRDGTEKILPNRKQIERFRRTIIDKICCDSTSSADISREKVEKFKKNLVAKSIGQKADAGRMFDQENRT